MLLTGAEATEGALKALAAPPRVLHLATHGYYLETGSVEGQPLLQSGITLAGANRALAGEVGPDGENGVLHAVEAQTLNLYGTELVVLSACDTGQGAVDYSEGLEGLPRALYVAGRQERAGGALADRRSRGAQLHGALLRDLARPADQRPRPRPAPDQARLHH